MRMSRLPSRLTISCAVLGLLALPTSDADAAPTAAQYRRHPSAWETPVAEGSRGLVRAAAMTDHLRPDYTLAGRTSKPGADATRPHFGMDHRAARTRFGGGSGTADLSGTPGAHRGESTGSPSFPSSPSNPIPEPSSLLLLAAGAGLVALIARRKLV